MQTLDFKEMITELQSKIPLYRLSPHRYWKELFRDPSIMPIRGRTRKL